MCKVAVSLPARFTGFTHSVRILCLILTVVAFPLLAAPFTFAQAAGSSPVPATLSFDVATVKPIAPDARPTKGWVGIQFRPDGMEFASQTLPDLLCYAYDYKNLRFDGQVTGLPDWALRQRYDIVAKISPADMPAYQKLSTDQQDQWRQAMVRSLLAQRFALAAHRGSKQVPIYALVVGKDGIKMKDAATDTDPPQLGKADDGKPISTLRWGKDTTIFQANSMKSLADILAMPAAQVGRPVVDKTELTGLYNYTLDWSIYSASAAASGDAKSIFAAVAELGLKLQPSTASFETVVVDHVDKPSAN